MEITTKTIAILAIASVIGFGLLVVFSEIYLSVGLACSMVASTVTTLKL